MEPVEPLDVSDHPRRRQEQRLGRLRRRAALASALGFAAFLALARSTRLDQTKERRGARPRRRLPRPRRTSTSAPTDSHSTTARRSRPRLRSPRRMSPELAVPSGMSSRRFRAMGSEVHLVVPTGNADDAALAVECLFSQWEGVLSRFRPDSELSRLNARPGTPVTVGAILLVAVEAAIEAARATGGLFDPTLGHELVRLGYDRSFEGMGDALPSPRRPSAAAAAGARWSSTAPRASSPFPRGANSTWAGSRRGWPSTPHSICSEPRDQTALVSAGGDLSVLGLPPDRRSWPVLVSEDPGGQVVPLVRGALATSGSTGAPGSREASRATTSSIRRPASRRRRPARGDRRRGQVQDGGSRRDSRLRARITPRVGPLERRLAGRLVPRRGERTVGAWPSTPPGCGMTTWSAVTWDTARAGGFAAYILLSRGQRRARAAEPVATPQWPRLITNELHGYLSLLALVFIVVHVLAVLVDPFTHFGLAEVLVPFVSHYRPVWMGLGIVALYLLLAVWVSSRSGPDRLPTWRAIHVLAYGCLPRGDGARTRNRKRHARSGPRCCTPRAWSSWARSSRSGSSRRRAGACVLARSPPSRLASLS